MNKTILILGGNGFIGYEVLEKVVSNRIPVRCVDISLPEKRYIIKDVDYRIGDIWDVAFLKESLKGVDIVLDFISTTMPNTKDLSLNNEIQNTLRYYDYILSTMVSNNIMKYVFPSSGGAIYGSRSIDKACESDRLFPTTPYGAGKKIAEDIIQFYSDRYSLNARVLRIGNVYGAKRMRKRPQGVIDVFVQNALNHEAITIWGNANTAVRDYVFLEDVANAIVKVIESEITDTRTYNIGSGKGTSIEEIIQILESILGFRIEKEYRINEPSGVNHIVLSIEKIKAELGWEPKVELEEGIRRTIDYKRKIIMNN